MADEDLLYLLGIFLFQCITWSISIRVLSTTSEIADVHLDEPKHEQKLESILERPEKSGDVAWSTRFMF